MDKQTLREEVWDALEDNGAARFPFPPHGRIPNFAGADDAANRAATLPAWEQAARIKANPDAPQLPVRRRALHEGRTVYMAVPRLRDEACFIELDPGDIGDLDAAATVSAMDQHGTQVTPEGLDRVDLIVVGSVAVTTRGARVGKGEGYSDLEYALLREVGLVDATTPVVTTVHELQVVETEIGVEPHDVPLDVIVTPDRIIETHTPFDRPEGIDWSRLSDDRIAEIPILDRLKP